MLEGRGRLALATAAAVAMTAGAFAATSVAAVAVADCSVTRDVLVSSLAAVEGTQRDGMTPVTLTVVSRGCALPGTVGYALRPVTTDDRDLTYRTGVLTFAEGDMNEQTLTVDIHADALIEPDERFIIALIDISGELRTCDTMAIVTIVNDDPRLVSPASPSPGIYPCELHSSR